MVAVVGASHCWVFYGERKQDLGKERRGKEGRREGAREGWRIVKEKRERGGGEGKL